MPRPTTSARRGRSQLSSRIGTSASRCSSSSEKARLSASHPRIWFPAIGKTPNRVWLRGRLPHCSVTLETRAPFNRMALIWSSSGRLVAPSTTQLIRRCHWRNKVITLTTSNTWGCSNWLQTQLISNFSTRELMPLQRTNKSPRKWWRETRPSTNRITGARPFPSKAAQLLVSPVESIRAELAEAVGRTVSQIQGSTWRT